MRIFSSAALLAATLAVSGSASATTTKSESKEVLPFIADDYPKALALARAERKPIFLETWAPW
jgi:hypothetical protein